MKLVVLLLCSVVLAHAAPQQQSPDKIAEEQFPEPQIHIDDNGHFVLRIVDADGTMYEEEGYVLTNERTGQEVVIPQKGTYSYPDENGKLVRLAYDIDEPATGAHGH